MQLYFYVHCTFSAEYFQKCRPGSFDYHRLMEDIKAGDIEVLDGWFNAGFNTSTSGVVTSY